MNEQTINMLILFTWMALAIAMVTVTISLSPLFRWFRDWLDELTAKDDTSPPSIWYRGVRCPFCFSFWVTLLSMAFYKQEWLLITSQEMGPRVLGGLALWGTSALICSVLVKGFTQGSVKHEE